MFRILKGPLTAAMLSSVALVPAATIALIGSADVAVAKSEKSGGNGGGNGGRGNGADKSQGSGSKSSSNTKSASTGAGGKAGGHGGFDKFLGKLTGKDKVRSSDGKVRSSGGSAKVAATPATKPNADPMHPSNLGKMNGALNANTNAIIAHVRNGNTNGPIGGMAALAVAGYAAGQADELLSLNEQFVALDDLLIANDYVDEEGNPDLQAYLDALEPTVGNGEITLIEDAIASGIEDDIADALMGANNEEQDFASVAEYELWRDGEPGEDPIEGADELIAGLDGLERPSEEDIAEAEQQAADRTAAEDYMLSIWNKGDGDDSLRSEEEVALLEKLYERLDADGESLTSAIEEHTASTEEPVVDETLEDELTECLPDEACTVPDADDVASVVE